MILLTPKDEAWLLDLMLSAFGDQPPTSILFRGPKREQQTRHFLRWATAYVLRYGEAYAMPDRAGAALWLPPHRIELTKWGMLRTGMVAAPFVLGLDAFNRLMAFTIHTDTVHRRSATMPHYHLMLLGVRQDAQGKGVGSALLDAMLPRLDTEGVAAYLETQTERNVAFYERHGFRVTDASDVKDVEGLRSWGLLRVLG